ncbi:MAG: 50S ribosomal protein L2 [bacterium]
MPVKRYKPNNKGRRNTSVDTFEDVTRSFPEKSLIMLRKEHAGRSGGKITVRHRGGGERQFIRIVDEKRDKYDIPATVAQIEYDPNRNARLGLLHYKDGEKRYMIAPNGLKVGDIVVSSKNGAEVKIGNRMPLSKIPIGVFIYDVELQPEAGGKIARAAGAQIQLVAVEKGLAHLRMPSSEVRMVPEACFATVGQSSNIDHWLIRWGKAGRTRHRGFRPTVRGKAMNPVDHRHGGGEGKHPIGLKAPVTYTGRLALGVKTRDLKKSSQNFILSRRGKKKRT